MYLVIRCATTSIIGFIWQGLNDNFILDEMTSMLDILLSHVLNEKNGTKSISIEGHSSKILFYFLMIFINEPSSK